MGYWESKRGRRPGAILEIGCGRVAICVRLYRCFLGVFFSIYGGFLRL